MGIAVRGFANAVTQAPALCLSRDDPGSSIKKRRLARGLAAEGLCSLISAVRFSSVAVRPLMSAGGSSVVTALSAGFGWVSSDIFWTLGLEHRGI